MSEIMDVNSGELLEIVEKEDRIAALVWIRSCSACAKFKPVFTQLPDHIKDVRFLRMNQLKTIENLRLSESKGMDETPTTFIYCNGEYVDSIVGYHTLEETIGLIEDIFANRNC
jgi:hypothetical protein